jgi:hypothetical protein
MKERRESILMGGNVMNIYRQIFLEKSRISEILEVCKWMNELLKA